MNRLHTRLTGGREALRWFRVVDLVSMKRHVDLVNTLPTQFLVRASGTELATMFSQPPLQADYVDAWKEAEGKVSIHAESGQARWYRGVKRVVPARIRHAIETAIAVSRAKLSRARILAGGGHNLGALKPFDPLSPKAGS